MSIPEKANDASFENFESPYGSNKQGLIWGYAFQADQPAKPIGGDSLEAILQGNTKDTFLWLHFSLSNTATERWIRANLALPDSFYESLQSQVGSTRLEQIDDSLVAVIHDVMFQYPLDPSDVSTVVLCLEKRFLITVRLKPLRSIDQLRASVKAGKTFQSSVELLCQLLLDQAELLVDIVRKSTDRVNGIEDSLLSNRVSSSRRELSSLRRALVRLQRMLAPEPAALFRLLNRPPAWIGTDDLEALRQSAEEFSAAVVDSNSLVERIRLIQEEFAAIINEQTNRTLFTLTMVTVIALPINLIAGLFGMNVGGIPLSSYQHGFAIIIGIIVLMTAFLASMAFRKK